MHFRSATLNIDVSEKEIVIGVASLPIIPHIITLPSLTRRRYLSFIRLPFCLWDNLCEPFSSRCQREGILSL
jgi:hypothetical protein